MEDLSSSSSTVEDELPNVNDYIPKRTLILNAGNKGNDQNKATLMGKGKRFAFTIEKDIHLLNSALNINPFQLGKWGDVCKDLKTVYGYDLKERTARERIEALLKKYEKEEFSTKTGTEEQRTERGNLLKEIKTLIEQESAPINDLLGSESEIGFVSDVGSNLKEKSKQDRSDKKKANEDRDELLFQYYSDDSPPTPSSSRMKRTKAAQEEDLIITKHKHDMFMEKKRFELDEEVKRAKIVQEDRRLEIDMIREKRLATEAEERNEVMKMLCKSIEFIHQFTK